MGRTNEGIAAKIRPRCLFYGDKDPLSGDARRHTFFVGQVDMPSIE